MTICLDGGLATLLQKDGLPPFTPVDEWLVTHPGRVQAAHAAFADAGAERILAATFRLLPHLNPRALELAPVAVHLARAAGTEVWASIGPCSTVHQRWSSLPPADRALQAQGWSALAAACATAGATGAVLETFVDPTECIAAVEQVRREHPDLPLVASLCPADSGELYGGGSVRQAVHHLRNAGATWVGFNCGTGPGSILRAVELAEGADWAKPSLGGLSSVRWVEAMLPLWRSCTLVGGCCGVGPSTIAELRSRHENIRI